MAGLYKTFAKQDCILCYWFPCNEIDHRKVNFQFLKSPQIKKSRSFENTTQYTYIASHEQNKSYKWVLQHNWWKLHRQYKQPTTFCLDAYSHSSLKLLTLSSEARTEADCMYKDHYIDSENIQETEKNTMDRGVCVWLKRTKRKENGSENPSLFACLLAYLNWPYLS